MVAVIALVAHYDGVLLVLPSAYAAPAVLAFPLRVLLASRDRVIYYKKYYGIGMATQKSYIKNLFVGENIETQKRGE